MRGPGDVRRTTETRDRAERAVSKRKRVRNRISSACALAASIAPHSNEGIAYTHKHARTHARARTLRKSQAEPIFCLGTYHFQVR